MIVHLVATAVFWLNDFPLSEPGAGMPNTDGPGKIILGTVMYYKNVCCLHPGKYVQVNQYDEPWNTIPAKVQPKRLNSATFGMQISKNYVSMLSKYIDGLFDTSSIDICIRN